MLDNVKITERQFIVLVILYIIGSAILVIPSILVSLAKQDAWITAILTVGVALSIMSLYVLLGRRFPNMTLIGGNSRCMVGKNGFSLVFDFSSRRCFPYAL